MTFLLAPLSFSTGQTKRTQFWCYASLPVSQLSSSISFLCCTGAEHYVNLVIGTGPSPLYGFLLSRSTWLVKEDGMKINEVQLIRGGGGGTSPTLPLRRLSPQLCCFSTPFFYIACFNPWTVALPFVLQSQHSIPAWLMSLQQSVFFLWIEKPSSPK